MYSPSTMSANKDAGEDWYKAGLTWMQKWRVQAVKHRRGGLLPSAAEANKWTPWAFQFVCLGSAVWMILVAVPYHYGNDLLWFFVTEAFTIYSLVQIIINWLFICFTPSTYVPGEASSSTVDYEESLRNDNVSEEGTEGAAGTNRIMIATGVSDNKVERKSVPYWSWTHCVVCQRKRPPRCHHCTLCDKCVLKRDHHCYFTRNCVGVYNQRYFIYFLFWCIVFTNTGCYQLLPYIFKVAFRQYSYIDLIVPINFIRAFLGYFPFSYCHLVIIMWGGLFLTFLSLIMFGSAFSLVLRGVTKFENDSGIKVTDTRSILDRIRSVMGQNWAVGLLIPGGASFHFVRSRTPTLFTPSQPVEDPVRWPFIKT